MAFVSKSHVVSEARPLSRSIIHGRSAFGCPASFPDRSGLFRSDKFTSNQRRLYGYSRARAIEILSEITNVGEESTDLRECKSDFENKRYARPPQAAVLFNNAMRELLTKIRRDI